MISLLQKALGDNSNLHNELSTVLDACIRSSNDTCYERDGVHACLGLSEGRLETSFQVLRAVHELHDRPWDTLASFQLRLEADLKISFQYFLSNVLSVINDSLKDD